MAVTEGGRDGPIVSLFQLTFLENTVAVGVGVSGLRCKVQKEKELK